jgi:hypothetical protein
VGNELTRPFSRRPPISVSTSVRARRESHRPRTIFCRPVTIRNFFIAVWHWPFPREGRSPQCSARALAPAAPSQTPRFLTHAEPLTYLQRDRAHEAHEAGVLGRGEICLALAPLAPVVGQRKQGHRVVFRLHRHFLPKSQADHALECRYVVRLSRMLLLRESAQVDLLPAHAAHALSTSSGLDGCGVRALSREQPPCAPALDLMCCSEVTDEGGCGR